MIIASTVNEDTTKGEWQIPVAMAEEDMETGSDSDMDAAPPVHPVPTMQGAFEESMNETMNDDEPEVPDRYSKADSVTRRKILLEQHEYERTVAGRWKQKPGEKFHPLWKLVAQISFGMHLLQQGLAKSDEEVLKILQTHVDEVDGFLERTTEDFDLAQGDINERIRYLKLPLEHGQVFDQMLANRDFRIAIVEGNEKIEHIIDRTAAAMNDALKDVQKGLDATRELAKYMTRVDKQWDDRSEEHDSVYLAMIGNTEGWTRAFLTLQSKGGHLRKALNQLGSIVAEMQRRAGAASRKNLTPSRPVNGRYQVDVRSESPRSPQPSATPPRSPMKPLPTAPDPITRVASSQKYIKTSVSPSPLNSPYLDQSSKRPAKHADRKDFMQGPQSPSAPKVTKSPEPLWKAMSQEPDLLAKGPQTLRPPGSPEPKKSTRNPERVTSPEIPETAIRVRSPDLTRATEGILTARRVKSPEPTRNVKSSEITRALKSTSPMPENHLTQSENLEAHAKSSESVRPFKTPAQIMSRVKEASKSSLSTQPPSRRLSITERTRSLLRKKEQIAREDGKNTVSSTDLPIQTHSGVGSPAKSPTSPLLRRFSSRRAKAMSMSTYSTSPTSPLKTSESPILREDSPVYLRDGKPVPTQSSYGMLTLPSLAPMKPLSPIEHPSMTLDAAKNKSSESLVKSSGPAPILKNKAKLNDSEGNVNTNHPLLQKARHTRFAKSGGGDLPLRHYHSQGALTNSNRGLSQCEEKDEPDNMRLPKRSSSLLYGAQRRFLVTPESRENSSRSPTPNQASVSVVSLARSQTGPPEELGIHPAHRTPEPPTESPAPSPDPSTVSSATEQPGATPPPIATTRSGRTSTEPGQIAQPSRSAPPPTSQPPNQLRTQDHWQPHHHQQSSTSFNPLVSSDPKYKTTATINTPFYLNPASSSALTDFLASTPPPSPPHPGTRVDSPSGIHSKPTKFFNRSFITNSYPKDQEGSSPPPPGPGSRSMTNLGRVLTGGDRADEPQRKGWKKVFGGTIKGPRKNSGDGAKSVKKKLDVSRGRWGRDLVVNGNGASSKKEKGENGGFVGMGSDGVWISRKNFLKT